MENFQICTIFNAHFTDTYTKVNYILMLKQNVFRLAISSNWIYAIRYRTSSDELSRVKSLYIKAQIDFNPITLYAPTACRISSQWCIKLKLNCKIRYIIFVCVWKRTVSVLSMYDYLFTTCLFPMVFLGVYLRVPDFPLRWFDYDYNALYSFFLKFPIRVSVLTTLCW